MLWAADDARCPGRRRDDPADSRIVVCYGAANRDERVIPEPDRLDIDRPRVRHFGFGSARTFASGATARAMLKTILAPLLPALGEYELDLSEIGTRQTHDGARLLQAADQLEALMSDIRLDGDAFFEDPIRPTGGCGITIRRSGDEATGFWFLSRHADVIAALAAPDHFSSARGNALRRLRNASA